MFTLLFTLTLDSAFALTCDLYPTNTCASTVATVTKSGSYAKAKVNTSGYARMDVFAYLCAPKDWSLHIADSPTANGFGGDSATTDHDSELYLINDGVYWDSTYDFARSQYAGWVGIEDVLNPDWADGSGCYAVRLGFVNNGTRAKIPSAEFDPDAWSLSSVSPLVQLNSTHGARNSYTASSSATDTSRSSSSDWEDKALKDMTSWYVGMNQVVGGGRYGSGLSEACVVLSTTTTVPSSCL